MQRLMWLAMLGTAGALLAPALAHGGEEPELEARGVAVAGTTVREARVNVDPLVDGAVADVRVRIGDLDERFLALVTVEQVASVFDNAAFRFTVKSEAAGLELSGAGAAAGADAMAADAGAFAALAQGKLRDFNLLLRQVDPDADA